MKTHSFPFTIVLLAASLLTATGCPKKTNPQVALAQSGPALADSTPATSTTPVNPPIPGPSAPSTPSPDLFNEMNTALAAATFEKHEGLAAVQQRMDREIDSKIQAWKAAGHNVTLAEDEKLDSATEDFAEKLRMLTLSSAEVWDSAKHDTELSLQTVRSAYIAIMNKPAKK